VVHIIIYSTILLSLFFLCLLEDREMEVELQYLIKYRRIQDASRKPVER